ncbi:DUF383-domain-containing protein [Thelephora terrestris]|uniref:Protein HGH1 homolog n=1 Tax=Thelephora terrestris TaxID=56493 RepID=A0A9P6HE09_9AGAM|nr:DUF383-domain-containing protein [Thelephora terrestris]
MESQLSELLGFLHDRNPQVRQIALSNLLGHTPQEASSRSIFFKGLQGSGLGKQPEPEVVRDLKLLCRDQLAIAHDAFKALVNLSDSPIMISALSDTSFLQFLVSYILNPQATLADLAAMLLSNLSVSASVTSALLSMKISIIPDRKDPDAFYPVQSRSGTSPLPPPGDSRDVLAMPMLVDAFAQGALVDENQQLDERKRKGELHFLASVFANITSSQIGRNFFLTPFPVKPLQQDSPLEYPLAKVIVFTEHKDKIRRGGVSSTIKNCAFHVPAHKAILLPETERAAVPPSTKQASGIDALPSILLPLAGPEELDIDASCKRVWKDLEKLPASLQLLPPGKKREQDESLRLTHIETLLLLSTTRWGRDCLRNNGVYEVLIHIERLVNLLKRDEGPQTENDSGVVQADVEDEDDDKIIEV